MSDREEFEEVFRIVCRKRREAFWEMVVCCGIAAIMAVVWVAVEIAR